MSTTILRTVQDILDALDGVAKAGERQWKAKCPAHADENPSLSVKVGDNGTPVLFCHARCKSADIIAKLGFRWSDFYGSQNGDAQPVEQSERKRVPKAPKVYATPEEAAQSFAQWKRGNVETLYKWSDRWYRVRVRVGDDKTFAEITKNTDGWVLRGPPKPHQLYRVAELPAEGVVYVCEGEKPCDAGFSIGLPCTTSGGTSSPPSAH